MAVVEVENLTKRFGRMTVLDGLRLQVGEGEKVSLFGSNGAGKTTLLRILANLVSPTSGSIRIFDLQYEKEPESIRKQIGFLSHSTYLYGELTAQENLDFSCRLFDVSDKSISGELLERVGLADRRHTRVKAFSRGMQQRLALARTLLHDPGLLLLDEPYTGLDPGATEVLDSVIHDGSKRVAIMVTHDVAHGLSVSDRYFVLRNGQIAASGLSKDINAGEIKKLFNPS